MYQVGDKILFVDSEFKKKYPHGGVIDMTYLTHACIKELTSGNVIRVDRRGDLLNGVKHDPSFKRSFKINIFELQNL